MARAHKTMIWDRTRAVQRLRHQLRGYFPAALEAFEDLDAPDVLELLARAPDPARAAKLTRAQVKILEEQVRDHFGRHPDAEIYLSQPGIGAIPGARVPGEFGDDPCRYVSAKARKNYGGTSPITRASGKKKIVAARFIPNGRLIDALMSWAFASLNASPAARAFYDGQRAKGLDHNDALRRLANRLVGILHGCLKTRTPYDEATAWSHRQSSLAA